MPFIMSDSTHGYTVYPMKYRNFLWLYYPFLSDLSGPISSILPDGFAGTDWYMIVPVRVKESWWIPQMGRKQQIMMEFAVIVWVKTWKSEIPYLGSGG